MPKLLYIEASPRKERSASIDVAHSFISTFLAASTDNELETLDLWQLDLPEFDGDRIG